MSADNLLTRQFHPRLDTVGLGWVNFQVMRRTHSTQMRERDVDPKVVADPQGHDVDVNLNVYAQTSDGRKKAAVDILEAAVIAANGAILEPLILAPIQVLEN